MAGRAEDAVGGAAIAAPLVTGGRMAGMVGEVVRRERRDGRAGV